MIPNSIDTDFFQPASRARTDSIVLCGRSTIARTLMGVVVHTRSCRRSHDAFYTVFRVVGPPPARCSRSLACRGRGYGAVRRPAVRRTRAVLWLRCASHVASRTRSSRAWRSPPGRGSSPAGAGRHRRCDRARVLVAADADRFAAAVSDGACPAHAGRPRAQRGNS